MIFFGNYKKMKIDFLKKENIFYLIFILTIFILDRCSKILVINNFNKKEYFINDYLNIDLIWNTGVGFGLLSSGTSLIYNTITFLIIMIIFVLIYVAIRSKYLDKLIFSSIIGGALGNLFDRIRIMLFPTLLIYTIITFIGLYLI